MQPNIDHISITVNNLKRAEKFYDQFLPVVGFDVRRKVHDTVPEHIYEEVEYYSEPLTLCLVNPREEYLDDRLSRRRPGALHHLAFRVPCKEAVDEAFRQVQTQVLGAQIIHPPQFWPEYCDTYYAFFLKDSEGIELEVVHYIRG